MASNYVEITGADLGDVSSVTATAPIASTGGTSPVISIPKADASHDGYLAQTDWSTFNSKQNALTIGNLTDAGTDGITVSNGTGAVIGSGTSLSQHVADSTHNGYLSSTDWSTFNAKEAASNPSLTILYVAQDVGNDSTGNGSYDHPYKTIQKAIDVATAIPATYNTPIGISVAPMSTGAGYAENLTISQQGILLFSAAAVLGRADQVIVFGTVTVNMTGTAGGGNFTASQNNFYMFGFQVSPSGANKAINFSGTTFQRMFISNCIIGQSGTDNAFAHSNTGVSSGTYSTVTMRECDLKNNSATNATINHTAGKFFIAGANPSVTNSMAGGPAINSSGDVNTNLTLNNASVTGLYTNSGTGSSTFTLCGFTGATTGTMCAVSSTGSLTLAASSVTNTASTGSGISNAGGTVTLLQSLLNIGTGTGAYAAKGTGVLLHALNAYITNKNFQNTLTILAIATTPTTGP